MNEDEKRARRVACLCLNCLRNADFYEAVKKADSNHERGIDDQWWITVQNNFLDICTLDWCKVFADNKGKHSWQKVLPRNEFDALVLNPSGLSAAEVELLAGKVRKYRDKHLAHLDNLTTGLTYPQLAEITTTASHLFDALIDKFPRAFPDNWVGLPKRKKWLAADHRDHHRKLAIVPDDPSGFRRLQDNRIDATPALP